MNQQPLVSIIIINWNGKHWLEKCLPSLKQQEYKNIEVVVVDNASTDGSQEFTRQTFPEAIIVQNEKNLGFAEANNIGYKKATGKYILLLNNDTEVDKNFLFPLVEFLEKNEKVGIAQPKILLYDHPETIQLIGSFMTNAGILYHFGYGKKKEDFQKPIELFSCIGACMLIKREVIEKVGLFDDDYFAYFEETDFCWRVWLAGYTAMFVPTSSMYHKGAVTSSKIPGAFINFHAFKNRMNSLLKNLPASKMWITLPLHFIICILSSLYFLLRGHPENFLSVYKAMWWNIKNFKKTMEKRKHVRTELLKINEKEFQKKMYKKIKPSYFYYLYKGLENYKDDETIKA